MYAIIFSLFSCIEFQTQMHMGDALNEEQELVQYGELKSSYHLSHDDDRHDDYEKGQLLLYNLRFCGECITGSDVTTNGVT